MRWSWAPVDSAQQAQTASCQAGENPCVSPVHEAGEMTVTARVDGQVREAMASVSVGDSLFSVVVQCGGSRPRGANAVCRATVNSNDADPDSVYFEWSFQGDAPQVFPDPAAQRMPPLVEITRSGLDMTAWEGRVVISGRVRVIATWRSMADTAEAHLLVDPRSGSAWGDLPVAFDSLNVRDVPTDSTKTLLQQGGAGPGETVLGRNIDAQSQSPNYALLIINLHTVAIDSVADSGPNAGLWYVKHIGSIQSNRAVEMRTWISGREVPKFLYEPVPHLLSNRGLLHARRVKGQDSTWCQRRNEMSQLWGLCVFFCSFAGSAQLS
jgi:hypothetical protein